MKGTNDVRVDELFKVRLFTSEWGLDINSFCGFGISV